MKVKNRNMIIALGVLQERTKGLLILRDKLPKGSPERKSTRDLIDSLLVVMEYLTTQVEKDHNAVENNRKSQYEC